MHILYDSDGQLKISLKRSLNGFVVTQNSLMIPLVRNVLDQQIKCVVTSCIVCVELHIMRTRSFVYCLLNFLLVSLLLNSCVGDGL